MSGGILKEVLNKPENFLKSLKSVWKGALSSLRQTSPRDKEKSTEEFQKISWSSLKKS